MGNVEECLYGTPEAYDSRTLSRRYLKYSGEFMDDWMEAIELI